MSIAAALAALALRPLLDIAFTAAGLDTQIAAGVLGQLQEHFADPSGRLPRALARANDRAWRALELSLDGDTWRGRCRRWLAAGDQKALAGQLEAYLASAPVPDLSGRPDFRRACLAELGQARRRGVLGGPQGAAGLARFADPQSLVRAEQQALVLIARELEPAYPHLAHLVALEPVAEHALLALAVKYFFRREVEADPQLFRGLTFVQLHQLGGAQEAGFAALHAAFSEQGQRLEELLGGVQDSVDRVEAEVRDFREEQRRQTRGLPDQVAQAVLEVLGAHGRLASREVRPGDSWSVHDEAERRLIRAVIARYRSLPQEQRHRMPDLLNAVGKLGVIAGDFEGARRDFREAAALAPGPDVRAEARFNAYRAALEGRDWDAALGELVAAARLDARRFAPFPMGKYQPRRILGAGGFGVAFLCHHKVLDTEVVVKALDPEATGLDPGRVFAEARVLCQLDHPGIVRVQDCAFVDHEARSRPYLVLDYFPGETLESRVRRRGPLPLPDFLAVALPAAEALRAAHGQGILHRDVKPANLLVRRGPGGWQVRLIDFGLAVRQGPGGTRPRTQAGGRTLAGDSIAGTLHYAAPEQLGQAPGVAVSPSSDLYSLARTCCYALFGTPQPTFAHWRTVPERLAELLSRCLAEVADRRPAGLDAVLPELRALARPQPAPGRGRPSPRPPAQRPSPEDPDEILDVLPADPPGQPPPPGRSPEEARAGAAPRERPPLPDRSLDQGYNDYLTSKNVLVLVYDQMKTNGPLPRHPEALAGECQRLLGLPGFFRTGLFAGKAPQWQNRFRACLLGLERWAYYYPEYRSEFVNLWNQSAAAFRVGPVAADHFRRRAVRDKYEG